jgi:Flp pilus assembly protein CpaB
MRASTMFFLIAAVLVGLGAAVAVKATGVLAKPEPKKEPPAPMAVVAATNIFEGSMIQATDVKLRALRDDELRGPNAYKKEDLLPPLTQAAVKRFAKLNIPADKPITKSDLEDMAAPPALSARLSPSTRAVNVAVLKSHAAGCLIQPGDWVDVALTTAVEGVDLGDGKPANTTRNATAIIARSVRVIAKRNSLWPVNTPLGPECPCNYTLETNPYRAALIDFAKDKGTLALLPLGDAEKRALEARRNELLLTKDATVPVSFSIADSPEYANEDERVASVIKGEYIIGESDLARIFRVKTTPPEKPAGPTVIERFSGVNAVGKSVFQNGVRVTDTESSRTGIGTATAAPVNGNGTTPGVRFAVGSDTSPTTTGGIPIRFRAPDEACARVGTVSAAPVARAVRRH